MASVFIANCLSQGVQSNLAKRTVAQNPRALARSGPFRRTWLI
jgi:hypothetical protein